MEQSLNITNNHDRQKDFVLFFGIFVSATMMLFGLALGAMLFVPVAKNLIADRSNYFPQLPLSEDREDDFLTISPGRQLFPAIAGISDDQKQDGNWIRIPSIGVNVPLVMSTSMSDEDVIKTLESGAALYPNGILPGRLGNLFISAHSTGEPWKGAYRFAFLRINELSPGNVINIDYEGTRYTYTITGSEIITPTPDTLIASDRPVPTLKLMACWPLWSTQKRMLVSAELTNVTKLTPTPF